jgi:hypothetical protein
MKTATQFIWQNCLQMPVFEPQEPKAKKSKHGQDTDCWLCGGGTDGLGWHSKDVIGNSFTDSNIAKAVHSQTVCYSCAALMKKEGWELACAKHGISPYFPVKDDKPPFLSNWMFNSHVFSEQGWRTINRVQAREELINPPKPPFVITLADAGKKHVIFRAKVNQNVDNFFIQLDENTILINRELFASTLEIFEHGYNLGFSKDSMLTGNYNQAAILKIGLKKWREIEDKIKVIRKDNFDLLSVISYCAVKNGINI